MAQIKQRLVGWAKNILIYGTFLLVVSNVISYLRAPEPPTQGYAISGTTLQGGKVTPESYLGQPLIVYVWATWCPTCRFQSPAIEALSKDYPVLSVAVNSGDDESVRKFLDENGYTFATLNDPDGRLQRMLRVSAFPTVFILDGEGKRVMSEVGYTSGVGLRLRVALGAER